MKKKTVIGTLSVAFLSTVALIGCGPKEKPTHIATFMADGTVVEKVTFHEGDTEINEPEVPLKTGYSGEWEDYTIGTIDITINAIYTLNEYTATFVNDAGSPVADVKFNITMTVDELMAKAPKVPSKVGYTGLWETPAKIEAKDITISPIYTINTHYAIYMISNTEVARKPFTIEADPEVPTEAEITAAGVAIPTGYRPEWPEWSFVDQDKTVNGSFVTIDYTIEFKDADGEDVGEPLTYTVETQKSTLTPPAVPTEYGYTGIWKTSDGITWDTLDLTQGGDVTFISTYTANQHTATYVLHKHDGTDVTAGTATFDIENDPTAPAMPVLTTGYTASWPTFEYQDSDITIEATETAIVYDIDFYDDEGEFMDTLTYTVETEKSTLTPPTIETKTGYTGHFETEDGTTWDAWSPTTTGDVEFFETYVANEHTATYILHKNDGTDVTAGASTFDIENPPVAPAMPDLTPGYTASWPTFVYQDSDITIEATETPIEYTATFKNGEVTRGTVAYTVEDTVATLMAQAPTPNPDDSTQGVWNTPASIVLGGMTITCNCIDKEIDFDDYTTETIPYISIKSGFKTLDIVEGEGLDGGKALRAVTNVATDCFLTISKDYLDLVFSDSEVKSLAITAKATTATSNFRHIKVDAADVGGRTDLIECYEANNAAHGVSTTYKTFYLTRGVYAKMVSGDTFIKFGVTGATEDQSLYIDSLKVSYTDADDAKSSVDFETGGFSVSGTDYTVYNHDGAAGTNQAFKVSGAGATSVDFTNNPEVVSHGNRALHIAKQNGYMAIYTSTAFYNSLDAEGMLFDMYIKVADVSGVDQDATPLVLNNNKKWAYNKINKWGAKTKGFVTYHLTKAQIGTDGRFLIFSNSHVGDIYFDNIRPVNSSSTLIDFESSHAWKGNAGQHLYSTGFKFTETTEQPETRVRDTYADYEFMANGANVDSCAISNEHVSQGLKSFKVTMKGSGGYFALFINPSVIDSCARSEKGLKIDVYLDGISFPDTSIFAGAEQGEWTTITIPFASFEMITVTGQEGTDWDPSTASQQCSNGRFYPGNCTATGNKTIYFDNIRPA